jgi:hypothetical protein
MHSNDFTRAEARAAVGTTVVAPAVGHNQERSAYGVPSRTTGLIVRAEQFPQHSERYELVVRWEGITATVFGRTRPLEHWIDKRDFRKLCRRQARTA